MKAVLVGKVKDKYDSLRTDLIYEYRGKTYLITAYNNGYAETLREQHIREQARIDDELDNPHPVKPYSDEAAKAIEAFLNYCENGSLEDYERSIS